MADAGFFKGTSIDQDRRFADKENRLIKSMTFPPEFSQKVDIRKVNLQVMRPWITKKVVDLVGFEDEVVVEYAMGLLEDQSKPIDPKLMQVNLTGFLESKTPAFMSALWLLLLDAQKSPAGVPSSFVQEKKEELRLKHEADERALGEARRRGEHDLRLDEIRQRERGERRGDGGRGGYRGGRGGGQDSFRGRGRDSGWGSRGGGRPGDRGPPRRRSPSRSRSRSRSPDPRRRGYRRSPSPANRRRSPSPAGRRRSPSPAGRRRSPPRGNRRSRSRGGRRSPSPPRGGRRSPSPRGVRRSPSPPRKRRSPARRSPSPRGNRRSPSPRRQVKRPSGKRSPSVRSPSPRSAASRSRSPPRRDDSPRRGGSRRSRSRSSGPSRSPSPAMRKRRRSRSRSPVSDDKAGEDAGVSVQPLSIRGAANAAGTGKKGRWDVEEEEKAANARIERELRENLLRQKVMKTRKGRRGSEAE